MRLTASLVAGALTASALSVFATAAPAAAAPASELRWQVSQQFTDHLNSHDLSGGATEDAAGVVTFPGGSGAVDPATGAGTIEYDGAVAGSFVMAGTSYYTVTVAEPAVTVEPDGDGEVTAVVSATNVAAMGSPAESTEPARVTVATFDSAEWTDGTLSATPHWAGVLPEGSESAALGIPAGKPVDGKSFAPGFLHQLTSGTRPLFYASGASSDAKKAPAAFTLRAPKDVKVTTAYSGRSVVFDVAGSGFSPSDGNPGDDGVYIGLAPAGGLPAVGSQDDMDAFAAMNWIPGSAISDGRFASTMTAKAADLKRGTDYAVYTWRAHTHSTTSQDTETPVTITWSKLKSPTKLRLSLAKKPTTKKAGKLSVDAGSATGKVAVKLTKGKQKRLAKKTKLRGGKATMALPRLAKGRWKVVVTYSGNDRHRAAKKALTFRVR